MQRSIRKSIKKEKYQEIVDLFNNNMSATKIATLYNVGDHAIRKILRKCGITNLSNSRYRTYPFNQDIYNDKHNFYYILGYTMADGCVDKNAIRYNLSIKDFELIDYLRQKLIPTQPIKKRSYFYKSKNKTYESYFFVVNNKEYVCRLYNHGIIKAKTGMEIMKNVEYGYEKDFVSGYFDGDGHVSMYNYNNVLLKSLVIASASLILLKQINQYINNIGKIHNHSSNKFSNTKTKVYELRINDIRGIEYFYKEVYRSNHFRLSRKNQAFINLFKEWNDRKLSRKSRMKEGEGLLIYDY